MKQALLSRGSLVPGVAGRRALLALSALVACGDATGPLGPSGPLPLCDVAGNRVEPRVARGYTDAQFRALGAGRSGAAGRGTAQTNAARRYVSAAGGDDANDGSEAAPWRTLQRAADAVTPGTTVLVDASGAYAGGLQLRKGGSPGAYVIFMGRDPATRPRILGDVAQVAVVSIDASYLVFQGFEIADHRRATLGEDAIGILVEPTQGDLSHVELRNNVVRDLGPGQVEQASCSYNGHGILAQAEGMRISDLIIDGNELHDLYVGNSEVLVVNGAVEDFCITSNYVHDVNNIAIDVIGYEQSDRETARRGVVADNVILDASNYWPYCTRGNCTYAAGDESSDGIYVDGGAELLIEHNLVGRADHGIELQSENGQLIRDVEVRENVVFNSNYRHFTLGPSVNSGEHDNQFFDDPALADPTFAACR
ncbi:MAG: right-handed parallel beta-helix repeat-containing protein [Kofleriaceae bacterium]